MNELEYWNNDNQHSLNVALMVKNLLTILITIVASKSTFKISSQILNQYCTVYSLLL